MLESLSLQRIYRLFSNVVVDFVYVVILSAKRTSVEETIGFGGKIIRTKSLMINFIHAVYYVKHNYINDTYKQKYDILSFTNHLL